jgi:class 3 adenylate cyclase
MRDLPTGTITFLFTDIEGSTRATPAAPQGGLRAGPRRGDRHQGDAFFVAFRRARDAVAAAFAARVALAAHHWPDGEQVRVSEQMGDEALELFVDRQMAELMVENWDRDEPERAGELHVEPVELETSSN